ncbi:hypothetical protein DPMN_042016 [Dreissena polymorpha]|uniref:Protein kish n=1 Tax=Dreissena polymorpha TaxID=45954 RepID=A0A9D4D0C5_DREPO|nr:hypothetical protein DPMN_042016 [Dreissena polymorpha]
MVTFSPQMTALSAWLFLALLVTVCTSVRGLNPQTTEQLRKDQLRNELGASLGTCTSSYSVTVG